MQVKLRAWRENMNVVTIGDHELFFSYETIVAYRNSDVRYRTAKKWSATTSKHLTQFGVKDWPQLDQTELESLVEKAHANV